MAGQRKLADILDPEYAQELLNDGWTVQEIAEDFECDKGNLAKYLSANGVRNPALRKRVRVLEYINLETLITKIQAGYSTVDIAAELPEEVTGQVIRSFIGNHHTNIESIRENPDFLRAEVKRRAEKKRQANENKELRKTASKRGA